MANSSQRAGILDGLLREAGIPIDGVSVVDVNATPPVVNIQYKASATQEQIDLGNQMLAQFDWRKRRALDRNTVVTVLQNLTSQQQNAIIRHVVCDALSNNPALAAKINSALGTALTVDEVDPT